MDRSWIRNTAISCAIACGAMVAGPGVVGTAVASADLFGIDVDILDIFGHKDKKKSDHGATRTAAGPGQAQAPAAAGGGGGGVPTNSSIDRAPNLAPVPTTPSTRDIVIRAEPPAAPAVPAAPAAPVVPPPVAVPPVPVVFPPLPIVVPPLPGAPAGGGAPVVPAAPSAPNVELPNSEPPPADSLSVRSLPESFRIGYADYLRAASTTDLLFAALPGVAGMVLLTAAGGAVGFRQAKAAQTLPSPQIARFLP